MISLVIPALDAAETLPAQLEALARQVESVEVEIVVSDNGSSDGTRAVVERWGDRLSVHVVDGSAVRGPGAARNVGVAHARGDFLVFTDADDIILPGWLSAWSRASARVAIAGGPVVLFSGDAPPPECGSSTAAALPVHMRFLPHAVGANMGMRRDVFEKLGGFRTDLRTGEDVELSWRAQLAGLELEYVREAVVAKRRRTDGRSQFRQHYRYGWSDPFLFKEFEPDGLPNAPLWPTAKSYLGLVARLPLLLNAGQRARWHTQAGRRAGRLAGSVRARKFYP